MIPFPFYENRFSFFIADHLLVGQLCTNPKSDRSLLSCLKVTQCSTSKIGDAPLFNSCTLPMCWRVWWSPDAIRWPVADPGCGRRTRRRPTSPKRPRLGFRRSATTLYPSLTALSSPHLNPLDYFVWSYVENITNITSHNTKASLIAAIRRVFAELPPALVEKACSQFRIRIEAVIEAEGGYIE